MSDDARPSTEAGRRLDRNADQLHIDRDELRTAILAIESEARATEREAVRERVEALTDGVGYIIRDEMGHAFDPAIVMRNAAVASLSESGQSDG